MTDADVFSALEQEMARAKLRGHVYLTRKSLVVFATETARGGAGTGNVGPAPVREAIDKILGNTGNADEWLKELPARSGRRDREPQPVTWNSPNLVVTGVMPTLALAAMLSRKSEYAELSIRTLMSEAGIENEAEAAALQEQTFHGYRRW